MSTEEQEIFNSLTASANAATNESPCGCKEAVNNQTQMFATGAETLGGDLSVELNAALDLLDNPASEASMFLENLSTDEFLEFNDLAAERITLEDVLSLVEKHPGLKITFSY